MFNSIRHKIKGKYTETLTVLLIGLLLFGGLNLLMVLCAPEAWTSTRYGAWTAFHKGFHWSGFDQYTYIVTTHWRPIYVHLRHPILAYMVWPLTQLNKWLTGEMGVNCAIYILGVVWTCISLLAWFLMYKILRQIVRLGYKESLLLNLFFFSLAYVMLVTFVTDHMLLTMTVMLLTIYLSGRALQRGSHIATWKMLLLYFIGTGITTTNGVKLWLMDVAGRWKLRNTMQVVRHSLWYLVPTLVMAGFFYYYEKTAVVEEQQYQSRIEKRAQERDSVKFVRDKAAGQQRLEARIDKQLAENPLFEWTDMSIAVLPSLVHNIFGEGLQLHKDYFLGDANKGERPVIVKYHAWYNYAVEALIVLLLLLGIVAGIRERFLWVCMMPFLFDMLLHGVLRFALTDVYIMTAHWAFIIPIAMGYLMKHTKHNVAIHRCLVALVCLLTCFLVVWNLGLIVDHMV